jgi:hypothetical protein
MATTDQQSLNLPACGDASYLSWQSDAKARMQRFQRCRHLFSQFHRFAPQSMHLCDARSELLQ